MTRFLDGPAEGTTLMLRRAPFLLRAVRDADGAWDALDQLEDQPKPDETIVVYRMVSGPSRMHVNRGRHGCAWYEGGDYRVLEPQPADDVIRERDAWQRWAQAEAPKHGFEP